MAAIILSGCNQSTKTQTSHSTKTQTKSNQPAAVAPKSSSTPSQPIIQSVVASIHGQPYGKGLQTVRFVSSTTGYMAGNGIILKTADGGQIFTTAAHASVNLTGLSVARTTTATVAAWGNHSILVSHNSGSNWSASTLPHTVQQVDFATSSIGFAITGHQGSPAGYAAFPAWVLWRTIDGGAHWIQVPTSSPPASISFGAASVGWMSTANGDIFRTGNSGQTWNLVTQIPTTNAESTSLKPFVSLHAASAQICWALVVGGSGMNQASYSVFRTTNGTNWSPVLATSTAGAGPAPGNPGKVPPGPGSSPGPMAVVGGSSSAVLAGECRACGFGTTSVSSTQNAGASWNNFPTIQNGGASISMSFVSPSEGWLLDSSGADIFTLLQTLDGGSTWKEVYPMAHPHPVNSVSFVNAQVGYGVGVPGDAGALLKSDNGGHTWSEIGHVPTAANGFVTAQLVFLTEQHGFLVYNSPSPNKSWIYETNDGGASWTLLKNPNGYGVSLTFTGTQDGVAFNQTQHWATTNGGKTWFQVHLKSPWLPWLPASDPAVAGLYLAGLAHLTMAKTLTDIVHSQNSGQYDQIGFAGSQVAWTPDQSQTGFLLTTDGGAKWSNIHGVSNVDFVNGEDGWALSGGLLRTTNGGKTWTYASHPTP